MREIIQRMDIIAIKTKFLHLFRNLEPLTFAGLIHLKELYLSYNQISFISEDAFDALNRLETLRLDNNRLKKFGRESFKGLVKVREIDLNGNPFVENEIV